MTPPTSCWVIALTVAAATPEVGQSTISSCPTRWASLKPASVRWAGVTGAEDCVGVGGIGRGVGGADELAGAAEDEAGLLAAGAPDVEDEQPAPPTTPATARPSRHCHRR